METEKAGHEAEERQILAPISAVHQTENLITKLQNGNQLPEVLPPQTNGDASWNHIKPNEGVNQMKRHGEKCSSPVGMQDMFAQSPYLKNGGTKHSLSEPSLFGFQQSKKLRVDPEINGQNDNVIASLDKAKSVSMASKLDCFPDHSKPSTLDCDGLQEHKLDSKYCNFSDGDIYSLSRNKQLAFPYGATVNSPSMEDTHGDLLEKTLSQYCPDHISIAPQNKSNEDSSKSPVSNAMPEKTIDTQTLSSGFPISAQNSLEVHIGDGYSASLAMNEQQPQKQSFPVQDALSDQDPCSKAEEGPRPVRPVDNSNSTNGTEGSTDIKTLNMNLHSDEEFNQDPCLKDRLQDWEGERFSPFTDHAMTAMVGGKETDPSQDQNPNLTSQMSQDQMPVEAQPQTQPTGAPESYSQQGSPGPARSNQLNLLKPNEGASILGPETHLIAPCRKGKNEPNSNVTFEGQAEEILQQTDNFPEVNWIDLNSSQPPQSLGLPQTWKDFSSQAQQQRQTDAQNQGQMQEFQKEGFNQSSFHQQEKQMRNVYKPELVQDQICYNTRPEWQQPHPKTLSSQHKELQIKDNKSQPISQQYDTTEQQVENQFNTETQQEHLFDGTQDIEQILESGYLQQQQPVPAHPSEGQLVQNALQHHPSLNSQRVGEPKDQQQDSSQSQLDSQLLNRIKLEEYIRLERELKSSKCKPQNQQVQHQTVLNPTARTSPGFLDSSLPNAQTQHDAMFAYSYAQVSEDCDFNTKVETQQLQYHQSPVTQKQYSQQHQIQPQSNLTGFPQPSPPQSHQPPQVPQGAFNQQMSGQMYPKAESQASCAKFQQGQLQNQNYREFQKHAALRMHLLQKQEKQGHQQSLDEFKHIKCEGGSRTEPPIAQHGKVLATPAMRAMIKQEHPQTACEQSQQKSIIATMEHQMKKYQLSPVFERKSLVVKSPNKVKVETSGLVTILSTNADLGGEDMGVATPSKITSDFTPTKKVEPNLNSFLESPLKLLDTPIKNLLDTPSKTQYEIPSCHCLEHTSEKDDGPYYTHLGAAPNITAIRELMEKRFGQSGSSIRIEKVVYTGKEGKSTQGCPIAKWVIRRASVDEKLLVLVRERAGHTCKSAAIVVVILVWEGVPVSLADRLYTELSDTLRWHGALTNRRCALNEERTCACQGLDPETCGASFSFGCSWSMYYNGCKFARSKIPRKFRLLGDDPKEEEKIEQNLQNLATLIAPTYKQLAPDAYANQVDHEHRAPDCRLGLKEGRPFSGVTACLDFCAHAHRDLHNMPSGSTVVCTLTREDNREIGMIPEDEQLHVLPLYIASSTDEFGSVEGQQEKIKSGAIQVLSTFRRKVRMLAEPAKSCRQRKLEAKRGGANKLLNQDTLNSKMEKNPQAILKQSTFENTGQNIPVTGSQPGQLPMGAPHLGHHPHSLSAQHQQQQPPNASPGSPHLSQQSYSRFPGHINSFPSTSQANMCPQSPAPMSPYPSSLQANAYLNGSNTVNPYPGSLNPNSTNPGYQCNGSMPTDSFHPYYASNQKHLDVYTHQRPQLYPQQQYSPHPHYRADYSPRYSEHSLQVNGYSNCNMRPNVHPMGLYSTYGPNSGPDAQFLEAIPQSPSAHTTMDYATVRKSSQYNEYTNPYPSQNSQMFLEEKDPFHTQIKSEMNLHDANGMDQVLPTLGPECLTPTQPGYGYGLPNGNIHGITIKQESHPEVQDSHKKEDVWSDNEHNFLDPQIGGVAVAPSHGSILIECAKRELHATTPIKNPDRNHPTRISLVFYQHKNMIEAKHGLALWEAKMAEKTREKEQDIEKHGADSTPTKNKKVKREHPEVLENADLPFKRFIQTLTEKSMSCTTNTYVSTSPYAFTKVTGPYNCYV